MINAVHVQDMIELDSCASRHDVHNITPIKKVNSENK